MYMQSSWVYVELASAMRRPELMMLLKWRKNPPFVTHDLIFPVRRVA